MFKYNWDLGVNRKTQSYDGRFDISSDCKSGRTLWLTWTRYGGKRDKLGYALADALVRLNTTLGLSMVRMPWVQAMLWHVL